jgi:transposase InsO family protein
MHIRTKKKLAGTSNGPRRPPGNLVSRSWFDQPPTECTPREFCVDNQEFYQLIDRHGISDDIHLFYQKLGEWEDYYNYHRLHGALEGQTPFERLMAKTRADVSQGS